MKLTFAFWNLNRKNLGTRLGRIASPYDVDILVVAECPKEEDRFLADLRTSGGRVFEFLPNLLDKSDKQKIRFLTHLPAKQFPERKDDEVRGLSIRRVAIPDIPDFLLAGLHLRSRRQISREGQTLMATSLSQEIATLEVEEGLARTVLVGDFNMNLFDAGMSGAIGLHAVMTKPIARKVARKVEDKPYRYFYNPMWGLFGDRTDGPPGTYYYSSGDPAIHFWNIYDQVLLRPELMDSLAMLRILDNDGQQSLVLQGSGVPDKARASDHLPILFQLAF